MLAQKDRTTTCLSPNDLVRGDLIADARVVQFMAGIVSLEDGRPDAVKASRTYKTILAPWDCMILEIGIYFTHFYE